MTATVFRDAEAFGAALAEASRTSTGIDLIREVGGWRLEPTWDYPGDPHSEAYHQAVLRHYRDVSGRDYLAPASNETFSVPASQYLAAPFPHCTADAGEVSRYLLGVGHIIGLVTAKPPARIAEFGAGWGHVSMHLARMGHAVTAIDINADSAALLAERAKRNEVRLDMRQAGFLDVQFEDGSLDVALFFESFHHCHRPFELLDRLERWISPGGMMLFAGEPFYPDFHAPWDVRLDGQSLWAAREHGWLELGFEESFFVRELLRRGWVPRKRVLAQAGAYGVVHAAARHGGRFLVGETFLPPDCAGTWAAHDPLSADALRWTGGASVMPLDESPRWRRATVQLTNYNPHAAMPVAVRCGDGLAEARVDPAATIDMTVALPAQGTRELRIESPTWVPRDAGINDDGRALGVAVGSLTYGEEPA